jgi:hypothetical protein
MVRRSGLRPYDYRLVTVTGRTPFPINARKSPRMFNSWCLHAEVLGDRGTWGTACADSQQGSHASVYACRDTLGHNDLVTKGTITSAAVSDVAERCLRHN